MDPRVEGLDPAVEHLRRTRSRPPRRSPAGRRRAARAPSRRSTPARSRGPDEARREGTTSPVLSETDRSARRGTGTARSAPGEVRAPRAGRPARPRRRRRAAAPRPAAGAGARRPGSGRGGVATSSPGRTATASWATIGPPSSVASTRWTVQPVTVTPWASASATAWAPGNAGRSDGCVLRIRPRERGQHRAGRRSACSRRGRRPRSPTAVKRLGQRRVVAAGDERGLDPLLRRPVERRAGAGRRRPGRSRRRARRAAAAAASARRFEPAPETPTATRPEPGHAIALQGGPRRSATTDRPGRVDDLADDRGRDPVPPRTPRPPPPRPPAAARRPSRARR